MALDLEVLPGILSTRDVAHHFDVPLSDVQYYIRKGRLKAFKVGERGYNYCVREEDVPDEWPPPLEKEQP